MPIGFHNRQSAWRICRGTAINDRSKHKRGIAERLASMADGGLLVTWGLRKRSPATIAAGIIGADLIYRGASGHCQLYTAHLA